MGKFAAREKVEMVLTVTKTIQILRSCDRAS